MAEGTVGIDSLGNGSIRVFDISDSAELELVHTYETGTGAGQMKISGNFLFMETGYMNFPSSIILDISDPMNLVEIIPTPSLPDGLIAIHGNYAFFVTGSTGLQVWDISKLSNPALVTVWEDLNYGFAREVIISNNYAYFATSYGGFRIVDITDPTQPVTVGVMFD
jgi:hypothetical protein